MSRRSGRVSVAARAIRGVAWVVVAVLIAASATRSNAVAAQPDSSAGSSGAWARARALADSAHYDEALEVVHEGLRATPDDTDLLWLEAGLEGWAGRHDRAVTLYTQLMTQHPDMADRVRKDLATERLWAGDPQGALRDFDRRLIDDPTDREAERLRALSLAHANRLRESLGAYDTLLIHQPGWDDAELDRAMVLAWMGRHEDARRAYATILTSEPRNIRARLGLAQNESWDGRPRVAAGLYRGMASAGDSTPEVKKGLAFAEYESGLTEPARELIAGYLVQRPGDREGQDLADRLAREQSPVLITRYEHSHDSDDLRVRTTSAEYRWPLQHETTVTLGVRHDDADDPGGDRDLTQYGGGAEKRWSEAWVARASLYLLRRHPDATALLGDVSTTWRPSDPIRVDVGWGRAPVVTRLAIEEEVLVNTLTLGADARVADRVTVTGALRFFGYSDGNHSARQAASVRVLAYADRRWRATGRFDVDHLGADQDLDHGYYDPESYIEWGPGAEVEWTPRPDVTLGTVARIGGQKEKGSEQEPFYNLVVTADLPIVRPFSLHLEGGSSNSNLASASGYQRNHWSAALIVGF